MKKIITILVLLSFAGTTVFANSQLIVKDKAITSVQTDMFSDVEGSILAENEMDETDGEGVVGTIVGAVVDGGCEATSQYIKYGRIVNKGSIARHAVIGVAFGALSGPISSAKKAKTVSRIAKAAYRIKKTKRRAHVLKNAGRIATVSHCIRGGLAGGAHYYGSSWASKSNRRKH